MTITMKVEGFSDLERELDRLSKAAGKGVLRRSLKKAAQPMADIAKSLAPDDPKTGGFDLAKSIAVSTRLSRSAKKQHRKMFRNDKASVEMFVGAGPLPQAVYTEFGTAPHINKGQFAGTQHPGTPPQPYIRPAFDAEAKPTLDRLGKELWAELEKSVARAERKAAKNG